MTVSVLYSEARHASGTQLTLTSSDVVVTSISSSSLTAGHRYLVFAGIIFAGSGRQLKLGGTADSNLRSIYANTSGSGGFIATPFDGSISSLRISNTARGPVEIFNTIRGTKVRKT